MGTGQPRLTHQGLRVLKLFSEDPGTRLAGADIIRETGLFSGTVYPLLIRFENYGLLESKQEEQPAALLGRPRRRLYSITLNGRAVAREALAELGVPVPAFLLLQPGFGGARS